MLGALRAILPGVAFAQTSATMVSLWAFDETTDVSGVFDDLGSANVPMSLVGTWADLTTGSLVQNVGGTSAYTSGTAYATLPANQPAHNLAALTISFYYQRNAAAGTQVLLAAGNGTQAGDFSIEVLADGKLRGFHVGQDGVSRPFEGTGGITGTNLQVGTAHRIDLALGPRGARIFLDGAELTVAAIPSNLNGWNNSRIKYLGVSPDGTSSPAIGAFDRFRIWSWQLTNVEIALLEEAQSTTLPSLPVVGDALSVPSLAEWLPSDETDPVATKFVSNQNRGNGSGSSAANAQEVQAALNGASPGDVLLAVCQTAGTIEFWNYPNGLSFPNGSAGNYITLQSRQGDAIVISACEDFAGARTPNSGFWTQSGLSQADIDKKIWRSTGTFSGAEQPMTGWWIEYDHPHMLLRYRSLTNLRAAYGTADSPTNYATPGVHKSSDGHVYIRMQRPHPGKYSAGGTWSPNLWPDNPEAVNSSGQFVWPQSENPNDYVIHLCRATSPVSGPRAFHGVSGSVNTGVWKQVGPGINSIGFTGTVSGSHGIVKRGTHYSWRLGILADTGSVQEDWFFDRARFTSGFKLSRAEFKFGGPLEDIRDAAFLNSTSMQDLYARDCTIGGFHEIMVAGIAMNRRRFRFRNCCFTRMVDEGFQVGQGMGQVEIGYCYFFCAPMGGGGGNGAEQEGDVWYIHHNVVDNRTECVGNWRATPYPRPVHHPHSPDNNQPRKSYNNTLLWGPDQEQATSLPWMSNSHNMMTTTGAANSNEIFNNITIRHCLERGYDTSTYSTFGPCDFTVRFINCDPDLSNEFMDYNLWYKDVPNPVDGWAKDVRAGQNGTGGTAFATLAAFRSSSLFTLSKGSGARRGAYTPGFEANSTDAKPTLPSLDDYPNSQFDYRPEPAAAVTASTTSSLTGADWWSGDGPAWGRDYFPWSSGERTLAPSGWKGALNPNGETMPVGVQNP
jgi:Concanavalin A-like lectin/glucanases superfamily